MSNTPKKSNVKLERLENSAKCPVCRREVDALRLVERRKVPSPPFVSRHFSRVKGFCKGSLVVL